MVILSTVGLLDRLRRWPWYRRDGVLHLADVCVGRVGQYPGAKIAQAPALALGHVL
jgi:hypothetical protein